MFEYGFEEDLDFIRVVGKSTGGRPSIDHAFTLDCAKEISMLQRNEKGKQARKYFIEVEKNSNMSKMNRLLAPHTLTTLSRILPNLRLYLFYNSI